MDVWDGMHKVHEQLHFGYEDTIYHKYELTLDYTQIFQSTTALVASGACRGINGCELYEKPGWGYLYYGIWYRRLTHFLKLLNKVSYLNNCSTVFRLCMWFNPSFTKGRSSRPPKGFSSITFEKNKLETPNVA